MGLRTIFASVSTTWAIIATTLDLAYWKDHVAIPAVMGIAAGIVGTAIGILIALIIHRLFFAGNAKLNSGYVKPWYIFVEYIGGLLACIACAIYMIIAYDIQDKRQNLLANPLEHNAVCASKVTALAILFAYGVGPYIVYQR